MDEKPFNQKQFTVFISATNGDLGKIRTALAEYFEKNLGAKVYAEHTDREPDDGPSTQEVIDKVTLNVCLVGHCFGKEIEVVDRPGDRTLKAKSWTQWELEYALERHTRERKEHFSARSLLIYFAGESFPRPEDPSSGAQATFRERVKGHLEKVGGWLSTPFYGNFDNLDDLYRITGNGRLKGLYDIIQAKRWEQFKTEYARVWDETWKETFAQKLSELGNEKDRLESKQAPLIDGDGQAFRLVNPDAHRTQLERLERREILGDDSANSIYSSTISFEKIFSAIDGVPGPTKDLAPRSRAHGDGTGLRLVLVTVSGIGKTTTLQRLLTSINGGSPTRDPRGFAVLIAAESLKDSKGSTEDNVKRALGKEIPKLKGIRWASLGFSEDDGERRTADKAGQKFASPVELAWWGVQHEAKTENGRLTILIDGLDHIDVVPKALRRLQSEHMWRNVNVVVAGRPPALRAWSVEGEIRTDTDRPDLRYWRMVLPLPIVDEEVIRNYLGVCSDGPESTKEWRYDLVADNLARDLLVVPRVLSYIRRLPYEDLMKARTGSHICYLATHHMVGDSLKARSGVCPEGSTIDRLLKVLGALAFQSLYAGESGFREHSRGNYLLRDEDRRDLSSRVKYLYPAGPAEPEKRPSLEQDLATLYELSTLVGNGVLEAGGKGSLSQVIWASATIQEFLAAYWLASKSSIPEHAGIDADDAMFDDAKCFRRTLFYPYDDEYNGDETKKLNRFPADKTEELNRFLAEMPLLALDKRSWIAAASAWYDPDVVHGEAGSGLWSSEMIARSWGLMHFLAGRQVDNWWDVSYEDVSLPSARSSGNPYKGQAGPNDKEKGRASKCLDNFLSDFQKRYLDKEKANRIAQDFVNVEEDGGWRRVPQGPLTMGSPTDHQGYPPRTRLYWEKQLGCALNCSELSVLANRTSPTWWWSGPYGQLLRKREVKWLVEDVFKPYKDACEHDPANREAAAKEALEKIGNNFRRCDETPVEEEQQTINAFKLNAVPVTNRVYALFNPGHKEVTSGLVKKVRESMEAETGSKDDVPHGCGKQCTTCLRSVPVKPEHISFRGFEDDARAKTEFARTGDGERPVIFVSWFDAWAFAQWVRWRTDGKKYRCRLPHEPEWEFACKHAGDIRNPVPTPYGQRYWWGNEFYEPFDSFPAGLEFEEEAMSTPNAHAVGWPGATRDPALAKPNGLGLKDMIGNVWEWSANVYDTRRETKISQTPEGSGYSRKRAVSDPYNSYNWPRSMRGGNWYYLHHLATASSRFRSEPKDADYKIGFRLVLEEFPPPD